MLFLFWVILSSIFYFAACEPNCAESKTCGQCMGHSFECAWCSAERHSGPRCQKSDAKNAWCAERVYNRQDHQRLVYVKNDPISSGGKGSRVVQLKPQVVTVTVRPGEIVNIPVMYKPAEDYPLDVYYLMDFSHTMKEYINLLQDQGTKIYLHLSNFTRNLQLGIGGFIEKPGLPYARPDQLAYAFKNHLSLTKDTNKFTTTISDSARQFGANLDDPEASLDALMQAMVCQKQLAWRNASRRIIVLCTDATYHSAGDGKMVGAAKLNDMQCHLNATGYYDQALIQDYPTVNQINKIAFRENMIIIFNAHQTLKREYVALAKKIQGAKYVELGKNIVKTITDVYLDAVNYLHMDVHVPSEHIRVVLSPNCINATECKVKHQETFNLSVSLTVTSCVPDNTFVKISPVGLEESLTIRVQTVCKCDCEKPGPVSEKCSGQGSLQCGICKCNENSFGDKCQCNGTSTMIDLDKCKANKNDTVLCNGHGTCSCGICSCTPPFTGSVCQYDDNGCPRFNGRLCGGRGRCYHNRCVCKQGYIGDDCHCPTDPASCRAPHSQNVCSGNGDCVCGECVCKKVDSKNKTYTGAFCDNCYECDETKCKALEKYVECVYFKTKKVCDEEFKTSNIYVVMVNKTEIDAPKYHLAKLCKVLLDDGQSIIFKHKYEDKELHIIIQKELEEPDRANMWIAIGSSIGAILLLGLLAVVAWKLLVDFHDAREYERFSKRLDEAADLSDVNPFYKAPTATFQNPAYNRKSRITSRLN